VAGFLDTPAVRFAASIVEAEDRRAALEGARIGPYRVVRELARGGMGAVYLAERADGLFEQRAALKLIKRGMDSDEIHRRFLGERRILARLEHPHIARLVDGGVTPEGQPWFAMEYVDGTPITLHCDQHALSLDGRLAVFVDVCDAVRYAHRNLVIHRDLKPSNILVTADGQVKLLDFGIAKLLDDTSDETTRTELRAMTPEYAAPEQVRGEPVTTATDVYALGAVLYELLTGRKAQQVERRSAGEVERVVCDVEPAPPGVNSDLDTVVLKALQKDPARRYQSVDALLEDVRRYRNGLPVGARPDTLGYRARKFARRHRLAVAAAAAVVASLIAGLAGTAWQARRATLQARAAAAEAAKARATRDFVAGLFNLSRPSQARGREITARQLLEEGRRRVDTALAGQPEVQAELLDVLGTIYRDLSLLPQADTLLRKSVALSRRVYGASDTVVASRLTDLGAALSDQGRHDEAGAALEEALAIQRRTVGPRHRATVATLRTLADNHHLQGHESLADSLYREVVAIARAEGDSLVLADFLSAWGVFKFNTNAFASAESLDLEALAIRRRKLDPGHPDIMVAVHNLAMLQSAKGDLREAERLQRDVLAERRRIHPDGMHTDVAYAAHALAVTLEQESAWQEAESLYVEEIAIRQKLLGPAHQETVAAVNNLAIVRYRMRDLSGAEAAMRDAVPGFEAILGPEHQSTILALNNLGAILSDEGHYVEADSALRLALERARRSQGERSPVLGMVMRNLGVLLGRRGDLVESERRFRSALANYRVTLPDSHPRFAEVLTGLGMVLTRGGRAAEAEPLLREALAIRTSKLGLANVRTAETQRELGTCLGRKGQYDEARQLLRASYQTYRADPYAAADAAETRKRLAGLEREAKLARYPRAP
jgi:serine/threonine-protein kinase